MSDNYLTISVGDDVPDDVADNYAQGKLTQVLNATLDTMSDKVGRGLVLPYFDFDDGFTPQDFCELPKSLDVYVCRTDEGQALNKEARGKDYATNILSYPSGLPTLLYGEMGEIPLGELVICHDVVVREASEQGKSFDAHLTHLVVHGILHLLGFDHELGQKEQDEMEGFEIEILAQMGVGNPYE